jgi:hypothetical protein
MRLLVNVTNRNDIGVQAMNATYYDATNNKREVSSRNSAVLHTTHDRFSPQMRDVMYCIQSGLQRILSIVSQIRWSMLSQLAGRPDAFNLLGVSLPILVNAVEWSTDSVRIFEEQCGQY